MKTGRFHWMSSRFKIRTMAVGASGGCASLIGTAKGMTGRGDLNFGTRCQQHYEKTVAQVGIFAAGDDSGAKRKCELELTHFLLVWLRDATGEERILGAVAFGQDDREDAIVHLCTQRREVDAVAQAQTELVIALGGFQVKRLPVHADEMGFAGGDDQVGPARLDLDA